MSTVSQFERLLQQVATGLATQAGACFFSSLVECLAKALNVSHAFVGRVDPENPGQVRTVAVWADGETADHFQYNLAGTPCQNVVRQELCVYPRDIQSLFPQDELLIEMDIESYAGLPLVDSAGKVMGLLVVLDRKPLFEHELVQSLMKVFGVRASVELERQQTEEALRRSKERFELAIRGSTDGLWDWDIEAGSIYFSDRFKELLGYEPEELQNELAVFKRHLHADDYHTTWEAIQRHLHDRSEFDVEYRMRTKSGDYRWFRARGQAQWSEKGHPLRMAGSIQDVTDLHRLRAKEREERQLVEDELARVKGQIVRQTRLAAVGQMSATVAHELRNPLGVVRNSLYLLRKLCHEPRQEKYLDLMEYELEQSSRIISELLAMSRTGTPEKRNFDVVSLLKEIIANLSDTDCVEWDLEALPDRFEVVADIVQLRQVFRNLLNNAVQATEGHGRVRIEVNREEHWDEISIADNGPGIPDEIRSEIFEPLFSTKVKGTGLGLTVSAQILKFHGGSIELISPSGPGAHFQVRLPRSRE